MEKNGRQFMLLDRCFNPAGVPSDNDQAIMIILAPPEYQEKPKSKTDYRSSEYDDDIPF